MNELAATGSPQRAVVELDRTSALNLLASIPIGRVVFSRNALPA
ncbi:pyridoxamine 5'-phosphate oxidase family protein, partial [Nocardia sp. NPDC049707]